MTQPSSSSGVGSSSSFCYTYPIDSLSSAVYTYTSPVSSNAMVSHFSSSPGAFTGGRRITFGSLIHHIQIAWIIDYLKLSVEMPEYQDMLREIDFDCLQFVQLYYSNSITAFGELCALDQIIQTVQHRADDFDLSMTPKLENDYEMLCNIHLRLKQLEPTLQSDQIDIFSAIFFSENENASLDAEIKDVFAQHMFTFFRGNEIDRLVFMYRQSQQRGQETGQPDQIEICYATYAFLHTQLKMISSVNVLSIQLREIEKQEKAIEHLQEQQVQKQQEGDLSLDISRRIIEEQRRLKIMHQQVELSAQKYEQSIREISTLLNRIQEKIERLEEEAAVAYSLDP